MGVARFGKAMIRPFGVKEKKLKEEIKLNIHISGNYNPEYTRNRILINGLEAPGI